MAVRLLSKDKEVLDTIHKGPLQRHPTGRWRAINLSISDYSTQVQYIEFSDSGSSKNDNTTKVFGTSIRLGHPPGNSMEVFSLSHHDSSSSGLRTCFLQLHRPKAHTRFKKWKIEWSEADSDEHKEFFTHITGAKKTHHVSFKIPTAAVHIEVFALGRGSIKQGFGRAFLPAVKGKLITALIRLPCFSYRHSWNHYIAIHRGGFRKSGGGELGSTHSACLAPRGPEECSPISLH